MEEAVASFTPKPVTDTKPKSPTESRKGNRKGKKRSLSPSLDQDSHLSPKKSRPQTPKQSTTPPKQTTTSLQSKSPGPEDQPLPTATTITITTTATKEEPRKKHKQPRFKYTNFPVKGYNILPTRNITSSFAKTDASFIPGNKAGAEDIVPNATEEWRDIIIIHPGSRNLRIGLASEAFPITVPHVIARRMNTNLPVDTEQDTELTEKQEEALNEIKSELKWRMKNAKRRAVPNAEGQVVGFNTNAPRETILDHNDPYKVEWTDVENSNRPEYFIGEKAIHFPVSEDSEYRIFYPWRHGSLNEADYSSLNAVLGDLEAIWANVIQSELEIEKSDFKNYNIVLVVPDLFNRSYLCELVTMLLTHMKFKAVIVQQESACATYGAGLSTAVVVDIGAQRTNIACVEDGVCQVDSRMSIAMGGDDVTKTFASFLRVNKFPYTDINLALPFDWRLAEELKEKWCTMNEAEVSIQVYDFFVRTPFQQTTKYQCKVYEEVFLAPLCLVYTDILQPKTKKTVEWASKNVTDDVTEDSNVSSIVKNLMDPYPIDTAIAESIYAASNGSEEKLKRYFSSIILVGGGGKIVNFSKVLEDRILSTVIAQQSFIERVEVLPAPRELDPEVIVWKGATVMSKLDSAKEMWIGTKEWEEVGARCLKDRALLL
ncbi:actin-like ATPase domain-containing protein [Rhizopus microsporus var. microsporus]|nr:actin-like ATPase domain-containing protein [Rhizopus microsporus var. microsporus]